MPAAAPTVGLVAAFREAVRMKSGIAGFVILASLIIVAVAVPLVAPYDIVRQWSSIEKWTDNARFAAPEWVQTFSGTDEPETVIFESPAFRQIRVVFPVPGTTLNLTLINSTRSFFWTAGNFPSELSLDVTGSFPENATSPFLELFWSRPDGQYVHLLTRNLGGENRNVPTTIHISSNPAVVQNVRNWILREGVIDPGNVTSANIRPEVALFARNDSAQLGTSESAHLLQGRYELVIRYTGFTAQDTLSQRFIVYGTVFGIAGTDSQRRDLLIGVMYGAPIALAFGIAAALVVVLIQAILGAFSGWYGGPMDEFIQRASDFYLIIPTLPILILIALFYRPTLMTLLFVIVAFGIVGSTTKVVRSIVLQVKEEQFIEAAQSYGASKARILFKYIMPRLMPYTFALIALTVPSYIFLEASLGFLGLGETGLPTWGNIIGEAYDNGALFYGWWWWVAIPTLGIVYTTVGFALLGYAFDKVLNPRLREE